MKTQHLPGPDKSYEQVANSQDGFDIVNDTGFSDLAIASLLRKRESIQDAALAELARKRVSKANIDYLAKVMGLSFSAFSELLPVSKRTIQRVGQNDLLSKEVSERIIEISQIYRRGYDIFGSTPVFRKWMGKKNRALGNVEPIQMVDTSFGLRMIMTELDNIEFGSFA